MFQKIRDRFLKKYSAAERFEPGLWLEPALANYTWTDPVSVSIYGFGERRFMLTFPRGCIEALIRKAEVWGRARVKAEAEFEELELNAPTKYFYSWNERREAKKVQAEFRIRVANREPSLRISF